MVKCMQCECRDCVADNGPDTADRSSTSPTLTLSLTTAYTVAFPERWSITAILLCTVVSLLQPVISQSAYQERGCNNQKRFGLRGLITSPKYPLPYIENVCAEWFIQGNQNDVITISIEDLDIPSELGGACGDSFLHIGPSPDRVLCGGLTNRQAGTYISKRSHVWIKFMGYGRDVGRGFNLTYIRGLVPYPDRCLGDEFRCNNGKCILSKWLCNGGNECGDFSDEEHCPNGIKLPVTPGPYDCGEDRFGCFDALTEAYTCQRNFLQCDGKKDCLHGVDEAVCNGDITHKGCGGELKGPVGYLSPDLPFSYTNNLECEWVIRVEYGQTLQLRFITFALDKDSSTNYVIVYDGGSNTADMLGKYYRGNMPPRILESTSNSLFVVLHMNKDNPDQRFNASYQSKGFCLGHQNRCGWGEEDCYDASEWCDGIWNCPLHGGDERGCGKCQDHLFQCGPKGTQCYSEQEHCNGLGHCSDNVDEKNCTPQQCGPHNGTYLCKNLRCVYESWRCDGTNDCGDNSDEAHCSQPSVKVITAAVIGSLICGLLLVIALGCTCKLYALRMQEQRNQSRYTTPLTRIQEEIFARRLAPPPYIEAMATSRNFDEAQREYLEQLRAVARQHRHRCRQSRSHGVERNRNGRSAQGDGGGSREISSRHLEEDDDDVPLIDITHERHCENVNTNILISLPSIESDSDIDSETGDPADNSDVNISIATGISAQWRMSPHKYRSGSPGGSVTLHGVEGQSSNTADTPGADEVGDTASASMSMDSVVVSLVEDNKNSMQQQFPNRQTHLIDIDLNDQEGSDGMSVLSNESLEPVAISPEAGDDDTSDVDGAPYSHMPGLYHDDDNEADVNTPPSFS